MDEFKQKLEEILNRLYKQNKLSIDAYSELMEFADPNQNLQLQQTGVSGRSEQLVSFLQWYIKDDMIREKKELIKSVVERYLKETNCH